MCRWSSIDVALLLLTGMLLPLPKGVVLLSSTGVCRSLLAGVVLVGVLILFATRLLHVDGA